MELMEQPLKRLACGCLVRCLFEGGGEWIEHKKCELDGIHACRIDVYIKEHKTCLVCGRCLNCFEHNDCNKLIDKFAKIITWITVYIVLPITNFIDDIKYKLKENKW